MYPGTAKSSPALKVCVLDNQDDPSFYASSVEMLRKWQALGNDAGNLMRSSGGHCGTHDWDEFFKCLDDGTGRLLGSNESSVVQV